MRKTNTLHVILEIVAIISFIFIGVTVLTFLAYPDVDIHNKSFIGSIILAIGTTELVQFLSLNYLGKRRNVINAVVAGISMALGIVFMAAKLELDTVCLIWAIFAIAFQIAEIINGGFNLMKKPLLNAGVIILCIVEIIYCVFLIINRSKSLIPFFTFLGVSLLVRAFLYIIEFFVHRYQK